MASAAERRSVSGDVPQLSYERLDVYRLSITYVTLMAPILEALPRGNAVLADQLKRASLSIPLNVAEAAGAFWSALSAC